MILYKYMSAKCGMKVIEGNSIAFSIASEFNDPFETEAGYPTEASNPIEALFEGVRSWGKRHIWTENYGVLCLTRTPTNALMWSHYANKHRGMVIGFDVDVAGFNDEEKCLIPAQYGSIIYTQTRPVAGFLSKPRGNAILIGHTHRYPAGHHEKLSRLFLQKAMYWSYEEEVRVVKCIADRNDSGINASGQFDLLEIEGHRLYCYKLPTNSIREIHLGLRHQDLSSSAQFSDCVHHVRKYQSAADVKACRLSKDTWGIEIAAPDETLS